jgi:hypothetical protein
METACDLGLLWNAWDEPETVGLNGRRIAVKVTGPLITNFMTRCRSRRHDPSL